MTFVESIKTCFKKYATFSGRASRSEFLWWSLFCFSVNILCIIFEELETGSVTEINNKMVIVKYSTIISKVFSLITLLPNITVSVRRFHDTDLSGWLVFMPFVFAIAATLSHDNAFPIIAITSAAMFLFLAFRKGTKGDNKFGKDPLQKNTQNDKILTE